MRMKQQPNNSIIRPSLLAAIGVATLAGIPVGAVRAQAPTAPAGPAAPAATPGQAPATPGGANPAGQPGNPNNQSGTQGNTTTGASGASGQGGLTTNPNAGSGSLPQTTAPDSPDFDLGRAVSAAINSSASLLQAQRNVEIDRKRADELGAQQRPNLSGTASATRFDQATKIAIGGGPPITVLHEHTETLSLVASLRLDLLGEIRATVNQARLQTLADTVTLTAITNSRILEANTTYFNLLRTQHQVKVAESALRSAQTQEDVARKLYEGQIGQKIDYLRARTQTAQAQQDLVRAQNDREQARASFNNLAGRPLDAPVVLQDTPGVTVGVDLSAPAATAPVGTTPPAPAGTAAPTTRTPIGTTPPAGAAPPMTAPVAPAPPAPVTPPAAAPDAPPLFAAPLAEVAAIDLNRSVAQAQANRPEVLQNALLVRVADTGIRLARTGLEPTFAISASGNYYPTTSFQSPRQRVGALTATITIPFYDGGATRARVEEARLRTENARTALASSQADAALQVRQAYFALSTAARQIAAANAALEQAVAARQLAQVRYEGQVGLFLEVTDAQAALVRAENAQVDAVYKYLVARAQFENAVGAPTLPATTTTPAVGAAPATPATPATGTAPAAAPAPPTPRP